MIVKTTYMFLVKYVRYVNIFYHTYTPNVTFYEVTYFISLDKNDYF